MGGVITMENGKNNCIYDHHHLLFQKRKWREKDLTDLLRTMFVYSIEVTWHRKLHSVVKEVPVPKLKKIYKALRKLIEGNVRPSDLRPTQACEWLIENIKDNDFRKAMTKQLKILREAERATGKD